MFSKHSTHAIAASRTLPLRIPPAAPPPCLPPPFPFLSPSCDTATISAPPQARGVWSRRVLRVFRGGLKSCIPCGVNRGDLPVSQGGVSRSRLLPLPPPPPPPPPTASAPPVNFRVMFGENDAAREIELSNAALSLPPPSSLSIEDGSGNGERPWRKRRLRMLESLSTDARPELARHGVPCIAPSWGEAW